MKGYQDLAGKVVFNFTDVVDIFKNKSTAYSALNRLTTKHLIQKVRNDLYVSINPVTQSPFANKYQIGSNIHHDAYVGYLSALEYYGYLNQVNHICYIVSTHRFNTFEFEGIQYKHIRPKVLTGVIQPTYTEKIRITDKEKTIIDCIYDIGNTINLEELMYSFDLISSLDESKLLKYLSEYQIQALYQKTGFLLHLINDNLKLSDDFYHTIQMNIGKSVTYLTEEAKQAGVFIHRFQLVVPKWLIHKGDMNEV